MCVVTMSPLGSTDFCSAYNNQHDRAESPASDRIAFA